MLVDETIRKYKEDWRNSDVVIFSKYGYKHFDSCLKVLLDPKFASLEVADVEDMISLFEDNWKTIKIYTK